MSGTNDRREEKHVPQLHGRIDENFAESEIDAKLWQVEYKEEDRDRLGPKAVSKTSACTAEDHCENKARYKMCRSSHWTTTSNASKTMVMENFLRSLDKRHWIIIST